MAAKNDKEKATLQETLKKIESNYGANAIMKLGDSQVAEVPGIPTGVMSVDLALGGKGFPRGRIVEIFGPESSGKTTMALHAIANAQKNGGVAAFIDVEHALDPTWAKKLGVDLEELLVSQPSHAEEALKIAEMLVKSDSVDIIVIDSVAALVPRSELQGEIGDSQVGVQARLMSQALRILTPAVSYSNTCLILINQIRMKIGVMFGSPETTSGGQALKFYASVRADIRRTGTVKSKAGEVVGSSVKVKIVKNKVAPPFRVAEFDLMYDNGANIIGDIIGLGENEKVPGTTNSIIRKSGSFYYYGATKLGQGKEQSIEFLKENSDMLEEIRNKILEARGMLTVTESEEEETKEEPTEEELKAETKPKAAKKEREPKKEKEKEKEKETTRKLPASN
ncbi:MAG: recombinase RecA [Gemmataceae bacterium]